MMETKHFIKISARYSAKNKLAGQIIAAIEPYDMTLCDSLETAVIAVEEAFHTTVKAYLKTGGKAAPPSITRYNMTKNSIGMAVADTIVLHIYAVERELSKDQVSSSKLLINVL